MIDPSMMSLDPEVLSQILNELPPDPSIPIRPRPSTEVLLERKKRMVKFWAPLHDRMIDDEKLYKMELPVEEIVGGNELGASEVVVLNDPYVLVEKIANMISAQDPTISVIPVDPGMKEIAQKTEDFLYWWRDEADALWTNNLHNTLGREEIQFLALRGWLCGRIMLDPGDADFPWRYDLVDPLHVFPCPGGKRLRWLFHVYKDSKINVLNDLGWNNDLLQRIEEQLSIVSDTDDVEVSSYYDDIWHVLFLNEEEVWSAPHNYGFVPWIINQAFGPPTRRTDTTTNVAHLLNSTGRLTTSIGTKDDYVSWWGVSIFQGIKDIYQKLNKLASAVMTEAMKAPNPPIAYYTNPATGEVEGKQIDTSIGATNYLIFGQEEFKVIEYGFKPSELVPLMQMLQGARDRGTLPSVMYGEGASYLSGFAVSLLTSGARDLLFPLIRAHQRYLSNLFGAVLKLTSEHYPIPISMVESDPDTGNRTRFTTITSDDIRMVGYRNKVVYKNLIPQDKQVAAQIAAQLVDKKIISLETARGEQYLGLQNPSRENKKVLSDLAYQDPDVVKASIPQALIENDPMLYLLYMNVQMQKLQEQMLQFQMGLMGGGKPPPMPNRGDGENNSPPPEEPPQGGPPPNLPFPMVSGGTPPPPPNTQMIERGAP